MIYDNQLKHYGIPGQKWGVRRFQYTNGSYTPEGKERYGVKTGNHKKAENSKDNNKQKLNSKTKKILIGAGLVTLGAVAGYLLYKNRSVSKAQFPANWPKDALRGEKNDDKQQIENYFSEEISKKLSSQEKDALRYYTKEGYADMNYVLGIDKSGNNPYLSKSNNVLCKKNIDSSATYREKIERQTELVKSALDKIQTPKDMIVNRKTTFAYVRGMFGNGISGGELADLLKNPEKSIGRIVETKGFCSTSIDSSANSAFGVCNLHILVPKGSKGAYIASVSNSANEQEFLIQCGSKYKIASVQKFNPDSESIYSSSVELFLELINDK